MCIHTGDHSVPSNLTEAEVDERMQQLIDMEDPDVVVDLRHLNQGTFPKYNAFWTECAKLVNEDIGSAVDDQCHGEVTHLAHALSIRDLRDQVKANLPSDGPVPSIEWIRLQFWPKTPKARSSLQHTGRFKIHFMVQQPKTPRRLAHVILVQDY